MPAVAPSPQETIGDRVDNDCDGLVDQCEPGQTDWWCCGATGVQTLEFNVVPNAVSDDVSPAAACVPLSVDPNSTCSLRRVVEIADGTGDNGCRIVGRMQEGNYPINSELTMGGGHLTLLGPGPNIQAVVLTSTSCADDSCAATACAPVPCIGGACDDNNDPVGACRGSPCSLVARHRLLVAEAALTPTGRRPLSLRFDNVTFTGGNGIRDATLTSGGGVFVDGANASFGGAPSVDLNGVIFVDNRTRGYGAGMQVLNSGAVRITDSTFRYNVGQQAECDFTGSPGGGLTSRGGGLAFGRVTAAEIRNSAIFGNTSSDGGGIYSTATNLTIVNSTISGNGSAAVGGGLMSESSNIVLRLSTVAGNAAGFNVGNNSLVRGGGLDVSGGTLNATGNVIVDNWFGRTVATPPPNSPDCRIAPGASVARALNRIRQGGLDCGALGAPGTDPRSGRPHRSGG